MQVARGGTQSGNERVKEIEKHALTGWAIKHDCLPAARTRLRVAQARGFPTAVDRVLLRDRGWTCWLASWGTESQAVCLPVPHGQARHRRKARKLRAEC